MQCGLKQIHKSFGKQVIFQNLDFDLSYPGFYMISGTSGSGKTTLLNILAGYEPYDQGERLIKEGCSIACIFQNYELIPTLTVQENIELYEMLHKQEIKEKEQLISLLGLSSLLKHYPDECSQGQKQRIGIARALFMNPSIILCDEPTESLDQENKEIVMQLLVELSKTKAVIVATHEKELMMQYHPMIYEIRDHKLITNAIQNNDIPLQSVMDEHAVDTKTLQRLLKQIHHATDRIQTIILTVLSICFLVLLQTYTVMFHVSDSRNVLNDHEIYVQTYSEVSVSIPFSTEPILDFEKLKVKGKEVSVNIVPYVENTKKLNIEGELPSGFTVLINQNTAEMLEEANDQEVMGSTLRCSYVLNKNTYPMEFTIGGIIEETDAKDTKQVYYDQDAISSWLASQPSHYKRINEKGEEVAMNKLQEMQQKTRFFVGHIEDEQLIQTYEKAQTISGIDVQNVLLDAQNVGKNERSLYHIIFFIMLVLLGSIQCFYIFFSTKKDRMRHEASYAILYACHTPLNLIKQMIMKRKLQTVALLCMGLVIESMLFCMLTEISFLEQLYSFVYLGIMFLLYCISLYRNISHIQEVQIALILKDEKDQ